MTTTARSYKIVPVDVKPMTKRISELRTFLAANIDVAITDNEFEKASINQQHLDTVQELAELAGAR